MSNYFLIPSYTINSNETIDLNKLKSNLKFLKSSKSSSYSTFKSMKSSIDKNLILSSTQSNLNTNRNYNDNNMYSYTNLTSINNLKEKGLMKKYNKTNPNLFNGDEFEYMKKTGSHSIKKGKDILSYDKDNYSKILKNLDDWDKDHIEKSKKKSDIILFKVLYNYYQQQNLKEELYNLIAASNMLKNRRNLRHFANVIEDGKQNKLFLGMIESKNKETGSILKYNLYKTKLKFRQLFHRKYSKEFVDNLNIDPEILDFVIEDKVKNAFYNKIIKEKIKYENQLHEELLKINNIIISKKSAKVEKNEKIKEIFKEKNILIKEYNDMYNTNRQAYWYKYDNFEQSFKKYISTEYIETNMKINKKIENIENHKMEKLKMFHRNKTMSIDASRLSLGNKKRKKSLIERRNIDEYSRKQLKEMEYLKKFKILNMNNEMNNKLKELHDNYKIKIDDLNLKQKQLEYEISIIKDELEFYSQINDELRKEHKIYYMEKLKKGFDCREEGLIWIVTNLFELQVPLDYHHFPKFLTHEQIDYIKNYSELQLKLNQLKIIISILKKKQYTQKMSDTLKYMDAIDSIENFKSKEDEDLKKENDFFQIAKKKIDKKFVKIYQDNIDIVKTTIKKNLDNCDYHYIINEIKKDLYHGHSLSIGKSKKDILNMFIESQSNKNFFDFLLSVKTSYQKLEEKMEKLFENEKHNYMRMEEAEEIYEKCFYANEQELKDIKHPSLKYIIYSWKLIDAFKERINQIKADIIEIKEKLKNYKGDKIEVINENNKLDEYMNKLFQYEKEIDQTYNYFEDYLITTAKRFDVLKNETVKKVYIKTSEDILNSFFKYIIQCEKQFLIFKDNIIKLKKYF